MAASSVDLPTSFERHPRAENKSARTVETYLEAVQQLDAFLAGHGVDLAAALAPATRTPTWSGCGSAARAE